MKTKQEIIENWLPRYTGLPLENFGQYILLTNFKNYMTTFFCQFACRRKTETSTTASYNCNFTLKPKFQISPLVIF